MDSDMLKNESPRTPGPERICDLKVYVSPMTVTKIVRSISFVAEVIEKTMPDESVIFA